MHLEPIPLWQRKVTAVELLTHHNCSMFSYITEIVKNRNFFSERSTSLKGDAVDVKGGVFSLSEEKQMLIAEF